MRETTNDNETLRRAARILSERRRLLLAKAAKLESAIECIDQETDSTTHLDTPTAGFESVEDVRTRKDSFFGMRLSTAVQGCLKMRNDAMRPREVLRLLADGGFAMETLGSDEEMQLAKLAETLRKNSKTFRRLQNGAFGLVTWYAQADSRTGLKQNRTKPGKSTGEPKALAAATDSVKT